MKIIHIVQLDFSSTNWTCAIIAELRCLHARDLSCHRLTKRSYCLEVGWPLLPEAVWNTLKPPFSWRSSWRIHTATSRVRKNSGTKSLWNRICGKYLLLRQPLSPHWPSNQKQVDSAVAQTHQPSAALHCRSPFQLVSSLSVRFFQFTLSERL